MPYIFGVLSYLNYLTSIEGGNLSLIDRKIGIHKLDNHALEFIEFIRVNLDHMSNVLREFTG